MSRARRVNCVNHRRFRAPIFFVALATLGLALFAHSAIVGKIDQPSFLRDSLSKASGPAHARTHGGKAASWSAARRIGLSAHATGEIFSANSESPLYSPAPSPVPPAGDLDFGNPGSLPAGAACSTATDCTLAGGIYTTGVFNIPVGVTVQVTGTVPLQVFASTVTIAGTLDASSGVAGGGAGGFNSGDNGAGGQMPDGTTVANGGQAAPAGVGPFNDLSGGGGGGNGGGGGSGGGCGGPCGGNGGGSGAGGNGIGPNVAGGVAVSVSSPGNPGQGGAGGGNGLGGPSTCCGVETGGDGGGGVTGAQGDPQISVFAGGGGGGHGGCSGSGCNWGGRGGAGGGAVQLSGSSSISISGSLLANGGGGTPSNCATNSGYGGCGGGGAGGTIWLSAPSITNTGSVQAVGGNGGGGGGGWGGGGGGGAGRIRVDTRHAVAPTGNFTPAVGYVGAWMPTLLSIDVTPANPTVMAGQTQQFTATGTFDDGTVRALAGADGMWTSYAPIPVSRRLHAAAAENGLIYVFGGCGTIGDVCGQSLVHAYNPANNTWSSRNAMPSGFTWGAAAAPGNGKIYRLGGIGTENTVLEYDPVNDAWTTKANMPTGRSGLAAVALDGLVYAIGGSGPTGANEVYDPGIDTWTALASMPTARHDFAAVAVGGKIYAIGGSPDCCGNGQTTVVEMYDPATNTWSTKASLPNNLAGLRGAGFGGKIYVFGGYNIPGSFIAIFNSTYEYDPVGNSWRQVANMPSARDEATATEVGGIIYVIGGADGGRNPQTPNEGFRPPEVTWSSSATNVATIDNSGLATALAHGATTIAATAGSVIGSTTLMVNVAPVASAGPDQLVQAGTLVTLDGSGSSDPENDPLNYAWSQLGGPAVSLQQNGAVATFTPIVVGVYTFQLTVDDGLGGTASDTVDVTVQDTVAPTVAVTRPNGGEKFFTNSPAYIRWTATDNGAVSSLDVLVSTTGPGGPFNAVPGCSGLSGTTTSCVWFTPGPTSTTARIQVMATDTAGNSSSDISNANFSIVAGSGSITVTSPNTAVDWGIGAKYNITWNHNLGANAYVRIEVSRDGRETWQEIVASVKNTGSTSGTYTWLVTGPITPAARIRVSGVDVQVSDMSNVDFIISEVYIGVATPATSSVNFGYGTARTQTWTTNLGPLEKVDLLMSTDGGATCLDLLVGNIVASNKTRTYTVPMLGLATGTARTCVRWTSNPALQGLSPANFNVGPPYVKVLSPNLSTDVWTVNSTRTITWASNLSGSENVKVELSLDGGASYTIVVLASTPSDGTQSVFVPAGWATPTAKIRITWLKNSAVTDDSSQSFPIN